MTQKTILRKLKNWLIKTSSKEKFMETRDLIMNSSWKNRIIFLVLIIVIGVLIRYAFIKSKAGKVTYETAKVEKGTLITSVSATGPVTTSNIQEVTTQASGVVKKMYVEDGQKVFKGQIVTEIELDLVGEQRNASSYASYLNAVKGVNSANNSVRQAKASLEYTYDQIKGHDTDETLQMKDTRTKAEVAYDNAYDGLKTANASLVSAQYSFNQTSPIIKAPSSGVINLSVAQGSQISAGSSQDASNQRIATITTEGTPIISVSISEIDALKVKTNQKVNITFDSIEDKTFTGKVVAMDKLGTTTSDVVNYPALVQMDSGTSSILPNMVANVYIITEIKTDVLLVPSTAISMVDETSTVQIMKDGNISTVQVEIGSSNDSQVEIVTGLNEGDEVVTSTVISGATEESQDMSTSPFSGMGRTQSSGVRNIRFEGPPGF
ncbi:hypothetical protein A2Z22_00065 [Candidatus Woesebacteria bacterium RBG_16_34_12]|uniref:RND efflux pump membrane fusion protein barrel-sandwich domain-containing protein n=1 Tax=Candidatus Woesebacteria bacterium RBG_16_34_12 TaxID=1802480 RepID=A0A1F7XBX0_9BACT|nr:MAG: hypothetical protein A2Z22_00065 [Candidatus Woesebacteria bacterium RBG_16_34_12]